MELEDVRPRFAKRCEVLVLLGDVTADHGHQEGEQQLHHTVRLRIEGGEVNLPLPVSREFASQLLQRPVARGSSVGPGVGCGDRA